MEFTDREKMIAKVGYISGYEQGHHDTVESAYSDSEESAKYWIADAADDGELEQSYKLLAELSV